MYCSECGSPVIAEKIPNKHYKYCEDTGERLYHTVLRCPKYRWWKIFSRHKNKWVIR